MLAPGLRGVLLVALALALAALGCGQDPADLGVGGRALRPAQLDRQGRPILPIWATDEELVLQRRAAPPPAGDDRAAPGAGYRVPAEFEPALAVVMTYTSYRDLLDELAPHIAAAGAEVWMVGGPASLPGVPAAQYRRLQWPYDSVWARDYGPVGVDEATRTLGITDTTYRHFASRPDDDDIPCRVAQEAGAACHSTSLILDGGNYMTDGRGAVFVTRRIYDWNSQLSQAQVNQLLRDYLGAQSLHVLDFAADAYGEPADGTGHIDMFAKLLPGCVALVADTDDAPFAAVCDAAAATFAGLECEPGRSYQVLRVPGWYDDSGWWGTWYTYTNSLVVNDTVLVPSYAGAPNATAQAVYQQALPGYTVVLVNTDEPILSGGSIHCITKEIPRVEDAGCAGPEDCDLPHVDQHTCAAGVCGVLVCDPGFGDCDGLAEDGCEQVLGADPHCRTCGDDCRDDYAHALGACNRGACEMGACAAGYADCDLEDGTGCETPTGTDTDCAGCGDDCRDDYAHALGACSQGTCELGACAAGYADCDLEDGTGCETPTGTVTDCAGCGDDCRDDYAHALGACSQGTCELGDCHPGHADCDGSPANGCEAELATDEAHCGDCPTACGAGQTCEGGACRDEPCPAGYADCDREPGNGCETPLGTDEDCAACGDDCRDDYAHALGACRAGACALVACEEDFADCDLDRATGCERSLSELGSCGACDRACGPGEGCVRLDGAFGCQAGCPDADGDGFADATCGGADCNDLAVSVNPAASERCNLGDDDCDGEIDEGGVCDRARDEAGGCGCGAAGGDGAAGGLGLLVLGLAVLGRRVRPG